MLIDSHCHLTFEELASQVDAVLARGRAAGVAHVVNIATDADDALRAVELLASHADVSFALGVHPHEAAKPTGQVERIAALLASGGLPDEIRRRIVAVGEIGLDYHYDFAPRERQEIVLREHLELAVEHDLPVVIHAREAEARVCDILGEYPQFAGRAVFHCYTGSLEHARRILDAGYWLSFTGVVTFKNAGALAEVGRLVPDDRFMLETDAPFVSPEPVRNTRPNEPALMVHTANKLANLRRSTADAVARQTTANAIRFFNLPEVQT